MRSPIKFPEDGGGVHAAETNAASSGGNETGHTPDDARVGIDIEQVDNLPAAADFGTDPFYVENFTPAEIAYCQRQPKPRESLCGLWCAKEAVKKCGAEFLNLRPLELEIRHDAQGRPFPVVLRDGRREEKCNCVISISHSNDVSVAVCVTGAGGIKIASSESPPVAGQTSGGSGNQALAWFALGLGLLNLLVWLLLVLKK